MLITICYGRKDTSIFRKFQILVSKFFENYLLMFISDFFVIPILVEEVLICKYIFRVRLRVRFPILVRRKDNLRKEMHKKYADWGFNPC